MAKATKKIIGLMLSLSLIITTVLSLPQITASAKTYGDFEYELINGSYEVRITKYKGTYQYVSFPTHIENRPVTTINSHVFTEGSIIRSITIHNYINNIEKLAFEDCHGLESIVVYQNNKTYHSKNNCLIETQSKTLLRGCDNSVIPDDGSVTSIGSSAFRRTSNDSIIIPEGVTSIGSGAFWGVSRLVSINIPDGLTSIGSSAFADCTKLSNITLPSSVTDIGYNAFYNTGYYNDSSNWENDVLYIDNCLIKAKETIADSYDIEDGTHLIADYAFSGCTGLTGITIPNSVTSIGDWTFEDCTGLTSITIPDSVTSIGRSAFAYCTGLVKAEITDLAAWCNIDFYDSTSNPLYHAQTLLLNGLKITDLNIPDNVGQIKPYAFYNCTGLTSVIIPDCVTSIGRSAFYGCTGIESISLSNNITTIDDNVFYGCTGLKSITIPDSVTHIGEKSFYGCISILTADLGDSIKRIGSYSFYDCTGLTSITLPSSLTYIDSSAFEGCGKLVEVINYSTLKLSTSSAADGYVANYAMVVHHDETSRIVNKDDFLFYTTAGNDRYLIGYAGNETDLDLPENYDGHNYYIYKYAFKDRVALTSIIIPSSVIDIGDYAFSGCTGLKSITIHDGVGYIKRYAFSNCSGLTSIIIGNSVTGIGSSAFSGCSSLEEITLPFTGSKRYVTKDTYQYPLGFVFGTSSYSGSTGISQYYYGSSTSSTTSSTYYLPSSLKKVTITDSTYVPFGAFSNCTGLTSITIPDSVTSIDKNAFNGCTGLESITVDPNNQVYRSAGNCLIETQSKTLIKGCKNSVIPTDGSVTSIGGYAFYNCTGLTSITIPNSVTSIGSSAFSGCSSLEEITLPFTGDKRHTQNDSYQYPFGYIFGTSSYSGSTGIYQYYYGYSTSSTKFSTYYLPSSLKKITVTDSTYIPYGAFSNCTGLTSVTITDSVTSIGEDAFSGCKGLETVIYCGTKEQWEKISIASSNSSLQSAKRTYHVYDDACDTTCNICGTTRTITHQYKTVWSTDGAQHWHECEVCGDKTDLADHVYDNPCDADCNVCGYVRTAPHQYKTVWSTDSAQHWHECSICGDKTDLAQHEYDNPCDTTCNVCGCVRTAPHQYKTFWSSDETCHWHECELCKNKADVAEHDFGEDSICDICGYMAYIPGDIDGNDEITDADAVYLLMHTFFPEDYPLNQPGDFDGDGQVTDADAVYLLMYTFFPEDYPIA